MQGRGTSRPAGQANSTAVAVSTPSTWCQALQLCDAVRCKKFLFDTATTATSEVFWMQEEQWLMEQEPDVIILSNRHELKVVLLLMQLMLLMHVQAA